MSQIILRANLLAKDFPLASQFQGNTVLFGSYDQKPSQTADGKDNDAVPEAIYMQNVLPTTHGYKSIAYRTVIEALPSDAGNVKQIVSLRDSDEPNDRDRGYLVITDIARTYLISTLTTRWIDVTPPNQPICDITVATIGGWSYVMYSNWKLFIVDMDTNYLIEQVLTGLTVPITSIIGVASSNNYMLMHDGFRVYWSNPLNALDFTPSLITGAGSEIPSTLSGLIRAIYPVSTGFAIYSTVNIVISLFTGNTRYPWVFKEANNSSGINYLTDVAPGGENGTNYAWTAGGLLQVSLSGCTQILPAVSDFIAQGTFNVWNPAVGLMMVDMHVDRKIVKLAFCGARYLLISHNQKVSSNYCSWVIVYDTALKRFGRLLASHNSIIEFSMDFSGSEVPYNDKSLTTYNDPAYIGLSYSSLKRLSNDAAVPGHSIAVVQSDGSVKLVMTDLIEPAYTAEDFSSTPLVILGKYQLARNQVTTLQEVDLECTSSATGDFKVMHGISIDGNKSPAYTELTPNPNTEPSFLSGALNRTYACRRTGLTHLIAISGSFNLVSMLLRFSKAGRR